MIIKHLFSSGIQERISDRGFDHFAADDTCTFIANLNFLGTIYLTIESLFWAIKHNAACIWPTILLWLLKKYSLLLLYNIQYIIFPVTVFAIGITWKKDSITALRTLV